MCFHFDTKGLKSIWSKWSAWKAIGRVSHALTVFCNEPERLGQIYRRKVILSPHVVL